MEYLKCSTNTVRMLLSSTEKCRIVKAFEFHKNIMYCKVSCMVVIWIVGWNFVWLNVLLRCYFGFWSVMEGLTLTFQERSLNTYFPKVGILLNCQDYVLLLFCSIRQRSYGHNEKEYFCIPQSVQ